MRIRIVVLATLAAAGLWLGSRLAQGEDDTLQGAAFPRPELAFLEAVNRAGPPGNPELLFLLMGQYLNARMAGAGAAFFAARLQEFGPRLSDGEKSLYLAAIALLRARHAQEVPLLGRIGWVRQTAAMLDEAKRLSGGERFPVRWIAGVVFAQLPALFGRRDDALADLAWCAEHAAQAPNGGWLREVYFQLAVLHRDGGDETRAQAFLPRSGYPDFAKSITLTTPFAEDPASGHTFSPRRVAEVVPGRVYALSGFEFTEYYFVVSADGRELIGIDAGTRPDAAQAAHTALREHAPRLPPITTILVTHAHWDHVGGHRYFRSLEAAPKFHARSNYRRELALGQDGPGTVAARFFGSRFDLGEVASFRPDVMVEGRTTLDVGGTRIELIPIAGGETEDGMLVWFPAERVLFAGDFIMPYLGAPFVPEGSLEGLLQAIDVVAGLEPLHLLHGHDPLNRVFASPQVLTALKAPLSWLGEEVAAAVRRGEGRARLQQANLIPPGLLEGHPDLLLAYLVLRENVINRVYQQKTGYWKPDLQGVDYLGPADRGAILVDYLGVSERALLRGAERAMEDGRYELAAAMLEGARARFPHNQALADAERRAYRGLMEKYQEFNPFKFILYAGKAGDAVPQMEASP